MKQPLRNLLALTTAAALMACTGGGSRNENDAASGSNAGTNCDGSCANASTFLTSADVTRVISQAVAQARAMNTAATIAVVDRVGNVLAVFRMAEVLPNPGDTRVVTLVTNPGQTPIDGGLEQLQLPVSDAARADGAAAIAKAITGAFLSSEGNAFSSRTASQIVQRNFNPGEFNQPSGPLFGVQFTQLPCSDFSMDNSNPALSRGPQRSPLGLSADPGGMPLYKAGTPVGGIGVISDDFIYGLDAVITDFDDDSDELIALAGMIGFAPPADREAARITVEGKTLRFRDADYEAVQSAANAAATVVPGVDGTLLTIPTYYDAANGFSAGTAFGQPESGVRAEVGGLYPGRDAFIFVDANNDNRFPPVSGSSLTATEVRVIIDEALGVANQARAQIRRPLGSPARVTISVVDANGDILGIARTRDAPVFGADTSLQKARTATLFSSLDAADFIENLPNAQYLTPDLQPDRQIVFADYVRRVIAFVEDPNALRNGIAFADRSGGNLSRPNYPDGIEGNPPGPLSKPPGQWSPFSTGLQLDMTFNALVAHQLFLLGANAQDVGKNCAGVPPDFDPTMNAIDPRVANGIQIFPGSVPIFRGDQLIGGIGISGDGIDQDDMISFLGLHRAGQRLGTVNNAPFSKRADQLTPQGVRLRYVNCPQSPFNDSDEQNVCAGK